MTKCVIPSTVITYVLTHFAFIKVINLLIENLLRYPVEDMRLKKPKIIVLFNIVLTRFIMDKIDMISQGKKKDKDSYLVLTSRMKAKHSSFFFSEKSP